MAGAQGRGWGLIVMLIVDWEYAECGETLLSFIIQTMTDNFWKEFHPYDSASGICYTAIIFPYYKSFLHKASYWNILPKHTSPRAPTVGKKLLKFNINISWLSWYHETKKCNFYKFEKCYDSFHTKPKDGRIQNTIFIWSNKKHDRISQETSE